MSAVPVKSLSLSQTLREQLAGDARSVFPKECCGLIEGVKHEDFIAATALHPVRNLAAEPDRFAIDPGEQFRLLRRLRGSGRAIVGCYHSHPNGAAVPSARDRAGAGEEDFVWLIVGVAASGDVRLAAHLFARGGFRPLRLSEQH